MPGFRFFPRHLIHFAPAFMAKKTRCIFGGSVRAAKATRRCFILSYVAYDESKQQHFLVTKTSRNARDWYSNGPPGFPLPSHIKHSAPWLVFERSGARLFYSAQQSDNTQQLRSAF